MQQKIVHFSELLRKDRWQVEAFLGDAAAPRRAAFPLASLGSLLSQRKESLDPQQHPDHLFNYLGLEHVQPLTGELAEGYRPRPGREVLSRSRVFREGDLLYGRLRPALNKVFVADASRVPEGICSGEFYVLTPDPRRLLPRFGRELLASPRVQAVVRGATTGSALPRLQLGDLLAIELPLPPLDAQRRYEAALAERLRARRALAAELAQAPALQLEALTAWLEAGGDFSFGQHEPPPQPDFAGCRLPGRAPRQPTPTPPASPSSRPPRSPCRRR